MGTQGDDRPKKMRPGDIVEFPMSSQRGIVRRIDKQIRLALIELESSFKEEPDDLHLTSPDACRVVVNVADHWPFLKVPDRPRLGLFLRPALPGPQGVRDLVLFHEWVPTGLGTGSIFLSPSLRLHAGVVLHAIHERGVGRLNIPSTFGTVAKRTAPAPVERPKERTVFDRLIDTDFGEDES